MRRSQAVSRRADPLTSSVRCALTPSKACVLSKQQGCHGNLQLARVGAGECVDRSDQVVGLDTAPFPGGQ